MIDNFPLVVRKFESERYCHSFRGRGADYRKCSLKKETYLGYKVHAMITLEAYITIFEILSASTDNREGLRDIVEGQSSFVILGDKGYIGESLTKGIVRSGSLSYSIQTVKLTSQSLYAN